MASWIKNMKGGATRLKDEFVRSLGAGAEGSIDPVFDYRAQRFNRYNESLDKLSKSMARFMDASQAYSQASVHLMHSFSAFFESQLQDYAEDEEGYAHAKYVHRPYVVVCAVARVSLAQSALRLEEVHQSLQANIFGSAREMQMSHVMRSVQELKKNNAGLQKQIQVLKQRFVDCDSVRRSVESQKRGTPEFERMAQRQQVAEVGLVALTNEINAELNAIEARRSVDMKNELLTVVACQVSLPSMPPITFAVCNEHFQQLLPLLPGIAKPLLQLAEHARARPRENPAYSIQDGSNRGGAMGVIAYTGPESRGVIEHPLQYHQKFAPVDDAAASVHPMQTALQFADLHFAEKLAVATYGRRQ